MAKKKKKSTRKKIDVQSVPAERSPFLDYSGAVLLLLLAVFLLIGGFGTGGKLPVGLFHGAYWAIGWAAYLLPISLAYWGIFKFKVEDRRLPTGRLLGFLSFLLAASAWFYLAFINQSTAGAWLGGHGGSIGKNLGGITLGALDKMPAAFFFFVLTVFFGAYAFWFLTYSPS